VALALVTCVVGLCGGDLLGKRRLVSAVSDALEVSAFELGELHAVGGVADVEVEHAVPDNNEALNALRGVMYS